MFDSRFIAPALLALSACGQSQAVTENDLNLSAHSSKITPDKLPQGYIYRDGEYDKSLGYSVVPDPKFGYFIMPSDIDPDPNSLGIFVCPPPLRYEKTVSGASFLEALDTPLSQPHGDALSELKFYIAAENRAVTEAVVCKFQASSLSTMTTYQSEPPSPWYSIEVSLPNGTLSYLDLEDRSLTALAEMLYSNAENSAPKSK